MSERFVVDLILPQHTKTITINFSNPNQNVVSVWMVFPGPCSKVSLSGHYRFCPKYAFVYFVMFHCFNGHLALQLILAEKA